MPAGFQVEMAHTVIDISHAWFRKLQSKSIALLIETSNGYCRGLLDGVIEYIKEKPNWSVQLTEQERGARPPSWLRTWDGDGIIARIETDAIGRRLKQFGLPVVDLSAARHVTGIPWADTDDRAIAKLAYEHFVERGFRHLGFCGDAGFNWSKKRLASLKEFATKSEIGFHAHESGARYDSAFNPSTEMRRISRWLTKLPKPIGIMACYDYKAQQVLDACRHAKLKVPEEVAVLGVDNDRLICELSQPPLSSIIPDTRRTGYEAAALLDKLMSGKRISTDSPLVTTPLGIKVRESTDTLAVEDEEVAKALHYIRRHVTADVRVADVLREVSLSRRSLEHRFKKIVGRTPHAEIQLTRMNRIKELLRETRLSVQAIAEKTGYEYGEYMAAAFKREIGMTPSEYRQS